MTDTKQLRTIALGLLGAVVGGFIGYHAFFWIAQQGFYALAIPPALLGLGAGLCARARSYLLGGICAAAGLGLGLFTEWRFAPFVADESLSYFIAHVYQLKIVTWLMVALGTYLSYTLALGRKQPATTAAN